MKIVLATAGPSSGWSIPPTNSSWLFLKARPRIDKMTMANAEITKLCAGQSDWVVVKVLAQPSADVAAGVVTYQDHA